ncbi:hypothetical protein [Vampirovibrio chlorellavorus]|uniref:hypothetical protein n=1 Tax=Vampirovibrio chlorellavorus TaxID=758823 RepID=UPI0026EA5D50|nr:hypothetical protein [Vampirovibrio chlorellavorus]
MPMSPIDRPDNTINPFEKSRLFKAAASALEKTNTTPELRPSPIEKPTVENPASLPVRSESNRLDISTRAILNLIQRFRLRTLTFEQLKALPLSQLSQEEKDFVLFMRKNPQVFQRISSMDGVKNSLSAQDVKLAAQLAKDSLRLSNEDLNYLQGSPLQAPAAPRPLVGAPTARFGQLQTQDLLETLQLLIKPGQTGLPFDALMTMSAIASGLRGRQLEALRFLQTTTVSKVLEKIAAPNNGLVTPEALRVLTSLLWNPSIYGSAPIVFFKSGPSHPDMETIHGIDTVDAVDDHKHEQIRPTQRKPSLRLEAHCMLEILHNISGDIAEATLEQLRQYEPRNENEEKTLHLLRQHNVFEALASLDEHPESLSNEDIKLALAEHALVLYDPFMVLVILP